MKKGSKLFYFAISLVVLIVAIFAVNAAVNNKASIGWEPASNVTIKIGTSNKLLTDTNSLIGDFLLTSSLDVFSGTTPISGHNADEIWVSVSGQETTLTQARATQGLCGLTNPETTYSNSPSTIQYHYATQIEMPSGKNLQEEINAGEVLYTKNFGSTCSNNDLYYADSCGRLGTTKKTECGDTTYGPWSDWSCTGTNTLAQTRTVYNKGCLNNACSATTTTATNTGFCQSGWTCSNGDCVSEWNPPIAFEEYCGGNACYCGYGGPVNLYDYCDGNKFDASTCPVSSGDTYCMDVKRISCIEGIFNIWYSDWQYRTYYCSNSSTSPSPRLSIRPPPLPPGGVQLQPA